MNCARRSSVRVTRCTIFELTRCNTGARSRSTLLSKGAVADQSRSVYTGLIEIEKGAKRTDARQTNHNLLLSPAAHADSVPNLDIRENDVMCAHASSVGPLDELQRWYSNREGSAAKTPNAHDSGLLLRDARQSPRGVGRTGRA